MLHIGRNILGLVISRVLAGVILFLIYTQLAQYLGPEAAGQYGLLGAFLSVFSMFVDLGMHQLVVKKVSEDKTHSAKYLNNYFTAQFMMGFVFMLIMAGFVFFSHYPHEVKNALYVTSIGLLLSSLSLPFRSVINAHQKLGVIAQVNFFNSVINAAFMLMVIVFRQDIMFLAFVNIAVPIFDMLVYGIVAHKRYGPFALVFDKQFIKQLFIWSLPFTLLTFFSIYNRIDALILPYFRGFEETGYYSAAYKFWDLLAFFPSVIGISLYPFFAETLSKNLKDQARQGLETYTRYMIAIGLPVSVGAYMLAVPITLSFYKEEFLPAAPAIWLLVVAASVLFIYSPVNSLIISQRTKAATKVTGFTLAFNFAFNLVLIPKYGFIAAAVVTVISEIIQLVCYTYIVKTQVLEFKFARYFVRPAVASIVMAAVLYYIPEMSVWYSIAIGGLSYAIVMILIGFFKRTDWELFAAAVNIRKDVNNSDL